MSNVKDLHDAVKHRNTDENSELANSVTATDPRGTYPLHVAAEFGQWMRRECC